MATVEIHGYSDEIAVAPGERIRFMVSCTGAESYRADVVRLIHGDTNPAGPGFKEELVQTAMGGEYPAREQVLHAGSHVLVADPAGKLDLRQGFGLHVFALPTTPAKGQQGLMGRWAGDRRAGYLLGIDAAGRLTLRLGDGAGRVAEVSLEKPLLPGVWFALSASYDAASGRVMLAQRPLVNATNSRVGRAALLDATDQRQATVERLAAGDGGPTPFVLAGSGEAAGAGAVVVGGHYNGKLDRPRVYGRALATDELEALAAGDTANRGGLVAAWDFADGLTPRGIQTDRVADASANGLHGECVNLPARGVTGYNWTGRVEHFGLAPQEYGAIHFHDDDVDDARWAPDFELLVPQGLTSDVYAARLRAGDAEEYIPFCVLPPRGTATADVLFLVPTGSYMAYANEHNSFDAQVGQAIVAHTPGITQPDIDLYRHPEFGLSCYDTHSDGSGIHYSSRRRPIVNMRPKYRSWISQWLWQFPADLHLVDWLNARGHRYDVATDEELHREGVALAKRYRVIVTGTHPEYDSVEMLDALEQYVAEGGRLMYLGANGFYWVISYPAHKPWVIEVRRGELGSRAYQSAPGEYHHSSTGERGGVWRGRARPPQKLVGTGFSAQGFDHGSPYRRLPDSFDPRARFIFEGVGPDEPIGDFGLGTGAAGLELDRYDLALGTPPDTLLLASSYGQHSDAYQHVGEEIFFNHPGQGGSEDFGGRADMTYFQTPGGGAVFSTSSIAWCSSLSYNDYDNNVSRITDNVLRAFASPEPLPQG